MPEQNDPIVIKDLVKKLGSNSAKDKAEAERILDTLGPAGLDALLEALDAESTKRKQLRRTIGSIYLVIMVFMVCVGIAEWRATGHPPHFGGMAGWCGSFGGLAAASAIQKNATIALKRYDDLKTVGAFADGLRFQDSKVRAAVEDQLVNLLPRMRASDAHYLNDSQRAELNKALLRKKARPELVMAILSAWEQVGDDKAIVTVEKLRDRESTSEAIRAAADACLPYLRQSATHINATRTLLRASDSAGATPRELLRAAGPDPTVNPAELLRADAAPDHRAHTSGYRVVEDEQAISGSGA